MATSSGSRWRSSLQKRLVLDTETGLGRLCSHWSNEFEDLASNHVQTKFRQLKECFQWCRQEPGRRRRACGNRIRAVVAQAGSEEADHCATMAQVEGLLRAEFPGALVALVEPCDFERRSTTGARVRERLLRSLGSGPEPRREAEGDDGDQEMEEEHTEGSQNLRRWSRESEEGLAILLFSEADRISTEALSQTLRSIGADVQDNGAQLLVVLGYRVLPPGRWAVCQDASFLSIEATMCLFDSAAVVGEFYERLLEDRRCPLTLSPQTLDWMRICSFQRTRRSLTKALELLVLVCVEALEEQAAIGLPLLDSLTPQGRPSAAAVKKSFKKRLKELPAAAREQLVLTKDEGTVLDDDRLAQAAAEAALWKWRLVDSLPVWDELLCNVQPSAGSLARHRRLLKLLGLLWPVDGEEAAEKQKQSLEKVLAQAFNGFQALESLQLEAFVHRVRAAATNLPVALRASLDAISASNGSTDFKANLFLWFDRLREQCWQPLQGESSRFFLQAFAIDGVRHKEAVAQLLGIPAKASTEESLQASSEALLEGLNERLGAETAEPCSDAAALSCLLQSSSARSIDVLGLWKGFVLHCEGQEEAVLKERFQEALLFLHVQGFFVPCQGSAADGGGASSYRPKLRRRLLGRVVAKEPETPEAFGAGATPPSRRSWSPTGGQGSHDMASPTSSTSYGSPPSSSSCHSSPSSWGTPRSNPLEPPSAGLLAKINSARQKRELERPIQTPPPKARGGQGRARLFIG